MTPQIVDSHCHINMLKGADTSSGLQEYLKRAKDQGVVHMLCVCVDMETRQEVLSIAQNHAQVSASVGVHPNHNEGEEPDVEELVRLAEEQKVVAIGETGLDYYRSEGDLTWQKDRFRTHIEASKLCGKPLIIHTRQAQADTLEIMRDQRACDAGGVMHCFTENWDMAKQALDMGFYVSMSGIVTFKSATELQDVARKLPLDRLLIETDSPYLAPAPHRGKQNEPAYVSHVAAFLAKLRGEDIEELAEQTTENYYRLFSASA